MTAFALFLICRLSLLYTCDCIRTFFHLQIIFPSEPVTAFAIFLICRLSLRHEMQASFRHQAHCLSDSEFGRLADNRRMQRVANAAVLQVHTRDNPTVTPHHIHSYNAYLCPFFSCFRIPPGGLFSPSILLKYKQHKELCYLPNKVHDLHILMHIQFNP